MDIDQQIEQNLPKLKSYASYLTKHGISSDDLVQDAVIKAIKGVCKEDSSFKNWLFKIMFRLFLDEHKKRAIIIDKNVTIYDRLKIRDKHCNVDVKKIKKVIRSYDRKGHDVIVLRFLFEFSYKEISYFLNRNMNTVKQDIRNFIQYINTNYKMDDFVL